MNPSAQSLYETAFFSEPLIDLGDHNPAFRGILMPSSEFGVAAVGITSQFLDSAETYHSKYTSDDRSKARQAEYRDIFEWHGLPTGKPLAILDIGAGSGGNTFIPLLNLFPGSTYVATDLSPNLLGILNGLYRASTLDCTLLCVCTDACRAPMRHETFDLVVGSSILHHLIDPRQALERVHAVLKPNGIAIFFEPFEKGHAVVALAFKQILRQSREGRALDPRVQKVFSDMLLDWGVRSGRNKQADMYKRLDDKWLFTENYLNDMCVELGFDRISMLRRPVPGGKFVTFVENVLMLHSSLPRSIMPDWAWAIVRDIDETLSPDLSAELHIEDWFSVRKMR